ncbi:hypothetical protein HUO14_08195 [Parasphingorhabdus flavimaris]|uniref:Tetratricopeptide repeat protein n=1 Tax=Parasphingorhabdus flavimaris TaxID=266812 RepID=A0ABX2N2S8_9SPHN|nr:hypothetical protein [Parasphingorhabdus flavimaris]NVD27881.1 hypothetical protein [Parasphingorhabdus flavimaris]|tara:strand:+ start:30553 stop:30936 length:384 start_codon:yes stop_codon:yes gene_type:complete
MKTAKMLGIATGFLLVATPALAETPSGEIGYAKGALGYDALVAGDNQTALTQLEAADGVSANDPARLINLGQAYKRVGRAGDAAQMFRAAMNSNRSFDLVLANGTVVNSRKAAKLALSEMNTSLAAR